MSLTIICAWCGTTVGNKPGGGAHGLDITHGICSGCLGKVQVGLREQSLWDGIERRAPIERRKGERRNLMRNPSDLLVMVGGVVWLDSNEGSRRHVIRRAEDREFLMKLIAESVV